MFEEREGRVYRHVEHSRDPQCDLLSGLAGHHEDKERDHIDQECRQDVVHHVESCSSPDHDIVPAPDIDSTEQTEIREIQLT